MNILILGAGQVGGTLAARLSTEAFDITLVDIADARLRELRKYLDIQTVTGWASYPEVLRQAGAADADMLIAVTGSEEVNMVACQVSHTMFRTPTKIARVRSAAYVKERALFADEHMPVDVFINPEQEVTDQVRLLLENPGAQQVLDFANGRVRLVTVRAEAGSTMIGQEIALVRQRLPHVDTRIVAIFRDGVPIPPVASTRVEAGDEVIFIAAAGHINSVMAELRYVTPAFSRIAIAGGGHIGSRLASEVSPYFKVKLMDRQRGLADALSTSLDDAVVLCGDASNQDNLKSLIDNTDVYCAVTNVDEVNYMSSLMARRMGVRRVMTLISKPEYVDLLHNSGIDVAISPHQSTLSTLLNHVRRGDFVRVHSLRQGLSEAMEIVARGSARESRVVGKPVKALKLPPGATVGAIVRRKRVIARFQDLLVEEGDHLILFLADRKHVPAVERLFQVRLGFF